ncbi:hypothetical protein ACO1PF_00450 [Alkalibacterium sp. f15]|uniref:hypothetical protein n=1 Tax=Alkalibacterium sp. f15 TaxID=3414029 RepID=UPI003BF91600
MNEILINSIAQRISLGMMTMEQVPPVYREAVQERLDVTEVVSDLNEPEEAGKEE